jgi:hypothetical protein
MVSSVGGWLSHLINWWFDLKFMISSLFLDRIKSRIFIFTQWFSPFRGIFMRPGHGFSEFPSLKWFGYLIDCILEPAGSSWTNCGIKTTTLLSHASASHQGFIGLVHFAWISGMGHKSGLLLLLFGPTREDKSSSWRWRYKSVDVTATTISQEELSWDHHRMRN